MRLGLLIYGSLDTLSGGYLYDRKLVEFLRQQGDAVEVVSLPWRSYPQHLSDNLSPELRKRLLDLKVDVLLQDELNHPSLAWLNGWLRPRVSYPIVTILHHLRSSEARPGWQNRLYARVERRYLRSLDGFVANSRTTLAAAAALLGEPLPSARRPAVIAHPGGDRFDPQVDADFLARRACQPGPLRVLFAGNLIARKRLEDVLAALALLPADCCTLRIAGRSDAEPGYARRVLRQAGRAGLGERVQFLGALSDDQLAAELRSSQVFAAPSSYEGFGIVYLEAMGFGLPVIAGERGAAHEIVSDGETGWLVPARRPEVIAPRLAELASDHARLLELSLAARQRYLAHPTWQASMASIRRFLREVSKR